MKFGFSLSPGGLLLPYHLGALASLRHNGALVDKETPIAGSSAGAIATMSYGCGLDPLRVLDATIAISDRCHEVGGARGRLLPLLQEQMQDLIGMEEFEHLQSYTATDTIGIAYREVFPRRQSYVQTQFTDRHDLFRAVSFSSMFPFFSTPWPFTIDTTVSNDNDRMLPFRLMVDGFFSVPRNRFGCPDIVNQMNNTSTIDKTIAISVFPQPQFGLNDTTIDAVISPSQDVDIANLVRLATQPSSREDLTQVFENGWHDAEAWYKEQNHLSLQS